MLSINTTHSRANNHKAMTHLLQLLTNKLLLHSGATEGAYSWRPSMGS